MITFPLFRRLVLATTAAAALAPAAAAAQGSTREAAAVRAVEAARENTPTLYALLRAVPKGGDLHSHLSGAVYAESYLRWAAEDSLCINRRTLSIVWPPCAAGGDTLLATTVALPANDTLSRIGVSGLSLPITPNSGRTA